MNATNFLLCVVAASGGSVNGRTLLQKRAFFVSELTGLDAGLQYDAHFYGPFSPTVESATTQLKNLGFVQESSTGFGLLSGGFEVRRYDYALTEDGKRLMEPLSKTDEYQRIKVAVDQIIKAGDPNYVELSLAAKAYFLLKKKGGGMQLSEFQKQAEQYNWSISPRSVEKALTFLQAVGLAARA
jgi:uncharacterized protein YwgA